MEVEVNVSGEDTSLLLLLYSCSKNELTCIHYSRSRDGVCSDGCTSDAHCLLAIDSLGRRYIYCTSTATFWNWNGWGRSIEADFLFDSLCGGAIPDFTIVSSDFYVSSSIITTTPIVLHLWVTARTLSCNNTQESTLHIQIKVSSILPSSFPTEVAFVYRSVNCRITYLVSMPSSLSF